MTHQTEFLEDLIREVLVRLPVKSLCRFRSVCKTWRDTLNHSDFKRDHLHNELMKDSLQGYKHNSLILKSRSLSSHSLVYDEIFYSMVYEEETETPVLMHGLPLQLGFSSCNTPDKRSYLQVRLRSSCDGLVLVTVQHAPHIDEDDDDDDHATSSAIVLNPCTREIKRIPLERFDEYGEVWGIGYDHLNCCYKVVRAPYRGSWWSPPVQVLSLKTNSWKNTDTYTDFLYEIDSRKPVTTNRCPHWTAFHRDTRRRHIIYFDASKEDFRTVPLPTQAKDFLSAATQERHLGIFGARGNLGLCMNNKKREMLPYGG
ncbi:hypothetical protein Tsubulata_013988 [Turnera subulata]|uniref:F-box domain-containing protein n=1 Tax=Turnera subulata TaxID=218843 RepID=A0A9Q0J001_9ROSI|nr:hypothetical protein Tsubulata_013988 [Turnera subulata]